MGEGLRIAKLAAEHSQEIKKLQQESRSLTTRLAESEAALSDLLAIIDHAVNWEDFKNGNTSVEGSDEGMVRAVDLIQNARTVLKRLTALADPAPSEGKPRDFGYPEKERITYISRVLFDLHTDVIGLAEAEEIVFFHLDQAKKSAEAKGWRGAVIKAYINGKRVE